MRSTSSLLSTAALILAHATAITTCAPLSAQISTTVLSTNTGTYPMSVVMTPVTAPQKYALVSLWQSSEQQSVNVTNPALPVVAPSSTATQDQYCRAWYTTANGGRLVTAHRFGGIRLWDSSWPILSTSTPQPQLSYTPTNYSHEGLKTVSNALGNFVLYSEQHTSPTGSGGLMVYRITPTSALSLVGQSLMVGCAGGALDISVQGNLVWQLGDQGNNQMNGVLRVFDTNGYAGNPTLLNTIAVPFTTADSDRYLERNAKQSTLVATLGWDGINCYDVTNPVNPTLGVSISMPSLLHVRGVTFIPSTNTAVLFGFFTIMSTTIDFVLVADTTMPGSLNTLMWFNPGMQVMDAKVAGSNLYCVGRDRVTLKSLLKIW
jgi:hypothetical protein